MRTWISFRSRRKCPPDSIGKGCWTITLWKLHLCYSYFWIPTKCFEVDLKDYCPSTKQPLCHVQHRLFSSLVPNIIKPSALSNPTEKTRQPQGTWSGQPGGGEVTKSICSISLWLTVHPPSFLFSSSFTPSPAHTRVRLLGSHFPRFCCVILIRIVKGAR